MKGLVFYYDMKEKIDPYLNLYDALYEMMPADRVEKKIQAGERNRPF